MSTKPKTGGLAGVVAGKTSICTVGKEGRGLNYRGYSIYDLADNACFEEVAYLLLRGELPTQAQLDAYRKELGGLRAIPQPLKAILEQLPADSHPMDVMRTASSAAGCIEPEADFSQQQRIADRLLACFSSAAALLASLSEKRQADRRGIRRDVDCRPFPPSFAWQAAQRAPCPRDGRLADSLRRA
ncbi:MAG: citrate/2-methylcitrate synthase [Planctomycetota bacterium]